MSSFANANNLMNITPKSVIIVALTILSTVFGVYHPSLGAEQKYSAAQSCTALQSGDPISLSALWCTKRQRPTPFPLNHIRPVVDWCLAAGEYCAPGPCTVCCCSLTCVRTEGQTPVYVCE